MRIKKIKIAAIIDFLIFRMGLSDVISRLQSVEYLGTCNRQCLAEFVGMHQPNLFFISSLHGLSTDIDLGKRLREMNPNIKLAVFLGSYTDEDLRQYLIAGFNGLMLRNIESAELEYAIRVMQEGETYISQDIASQVFDMHTETSKQSICKLNNCHLSKREMQVMYLVFKEFTNHEIALKLNISIRTVESHRNNVIAKTGARNSVGIAKFILQNQLVGHLQLHMEGFLDS